MADFNNPLATQAYTALLASIVENNQAALQFLDGVTPLTNLPTGAKRWNQTNARFEEWNGSAWAELHALYEIKVRNADQLNGQAESYYRNAGNLNAGTLPAARFNDTAHGNRSGGSLHAAVTTSVNGFMSATDKSKLNVIESGATGDQSAAEILALLLGVDGAGSGLDADLLDGWHRDSIRARANHTGTQTLATISDSGALAALNSVSQAEVDAAAVGRGEMKTTTVSLAGSVIASGYVDITLTQYAFFPMIHTTHTGSSKSRLSGHVTDGASADAPRFRLANADGTDGYNYDVDYRYLQT